MHKSSRSRYIYIPLLYKSVNALGPSESKINPARTAAPFLGQTAWNLTGLSPKRDCGSKRVDDKKRRLQQRPSAWLRGDTNWCPTELQREESYGAAPAQEDSINIICTCTACWALAHAAVRRQAVDGTKVIIDLVAAISRPQRGQQILSLDCCEMPERDLQGQHPPLGP